MHLQNGNKYELSMLMARIFSMLFKTQDNQSIYLRLSYLQLSISVSLSLISGKKSFSNLLICYFSSVQIVLADETGSFCGISENELDFLDL